MADFAHLNLLGRSILFLGALSLIEKFAASDHTVLIQGETGTGKELAARAIHYLGARRRFPFIPLNCGTLPDTLVESELFGHVRGAFTDAREAAAGIIAQARGGTLFLDEIEAISMRGQVALLRFLQDKQYRSVGGTSVIAADVRVICATNLDLGAMARMGRLRADLLYRINALAISLPPLRQRTGDVMVLAEHFLDRLNRESKGPPKRLHPESEAPLIAHDWPGNVRELENVLLRHYLLEPGPQIRIASVEIVSDQHEATKTSKQPVLGFKAAKAQAVAIFEKSYLTILLQNSGGNLSLASRWASKDRSDLSKLMRKYGLQRREFETRATT